MGWLILSIIGIAFVLLLGLAAVVQRFYRKVEQGQAIIRNGMGGTRVSFAGILVYPVLHRAELMDISVKTVEIYRHAKDGLVCKDNMRADIKVRFFVRVNKTNDDVKKVAQLLGCVRASDEDALVDLFDAKFSEALKTVGKRFDFTELYTAREQFRDDILAIIGTDLNGYVLDDAAIDYLEQTPKEMLNPDNILDAEGIKKITDLTAKQQVMANQIDRNREMTIVKQNVEAREAILELEKQQAEAEAKQAREIAEANAREGAQAKIVQEQSRLQSENQRIATEEEVQVAEQNKLRQVLVASKNKERTDAVETERVERDRLLEVTERERVVTLADIEKEKAVETERRNIQEVIRERVTLERSVVEEQEKIKDTEEFATADRAKKVAVTDAERAAESSLVMDVKKAEAAQLASVKAAEQKVIEADADLKAAERSADAMKMMAEAQAARDAVKGMAEVRVMEAEADALQKHGLAEAKVSEEKYRAEAQGITDKAEAMKKLDGVGKDHEEFKLELDKELQVELAEIQVSKDIAAENSRLVGEALKSANIDIVGGDGQFFDQIVGAVTGGKKVDRLVGSSEVLGQVREALMDGDGGLADRIQGFVQQFGINSQDVANLSVSALILKMMGEADGESKGGLKSLLKMVESLGLGEKKVQDLR